MKHIYIVFVSCRHASNFHGVVNMGYLVLAKIDIVSVPHIDHAATVCHGHISGRSFKFMVGSCCSEKWCSRHQYHHQSQQYWLAFAHLHAFGENIFPYICFEYVSVEA